MGKVNYEEAIKKPFTEITKLLIGVILSIIPVIHWVAKGFILQCSGHGGSKPSKNMPEWEGWGQLFIKGLLSDVILLIYAIPAILIFLVGMGFALGSLATASTTTETFETMTQIMSQNWYLMMPTIIKLAPVMMAGFILLIIALYLTPIAVLNYISTKKFSEAFTADYFIVWIIALFITAIVSAILSVIPVIGPGIAFFITGVIAYSLYGQIYKKR